MTWQLCVVGVLLVACGNAPGARDAAPTALPCPPGLSRCGAACVDLTTDTNHCGSCDNVCANGPAGSRICNNGCGFECFAGWHDCDPTAPGCEQDLQSADACGACGHVCVDNDSCTSPDCVGQRQLVANSTFAVDLASWVAANNPNNAEDVLSTFQLNSAGDAENVPSTGACARVLYQDVFIHQDMVDATFSAEVRSDNTQPLMPTVVQSIETNPFDGVSDAFRIDLVDPAADVFYAPILYTLFTTVDAVGTMTEPHQISVSAPGFVQILQQRKGSFVRVRISQVESNFPWHVDVDNVSLTLNIMY